MLKRSIVLILVALSLMWIAYVGFTLSTGSIEAPTPDFLFNQEDDTVIVIHKTQEVNYSIPTLKILQTNSFFSNILANQERIQHFYFGTNREVVLLERSKPWSAELVKSYAEKLLLSASVGTNKTIALSNGWIGRFHGKYLAFYSNIEKTENNSKIAWDYLDRKSSFSLIYKQSNKQFCIENNYFLNNTTKRYISKKNHQELPLINDQELFQEYIPGNFDSYTFYEKNYLKTIDNTKSILDSWMNYGVCMVVKKGDTCLISDFIPGQNPIDILSDQPNVSLDVKNKQATLKNYSFPLIGTTNKTYVEAFNSVVFTSTSSRLIDELIGTYETGNSLAQSVSLKDKLFAQATQQVSYRFIDANKQETISRLAKVDYETVASYTDNRTQSSEEPESQQLSPIRLDDDLVVLEAIPNSNNLLAVTRSGTCYVVGVTKIIWSQKMNGEVIGNPVFIGNGIFLSTSNSIYGFDLSGNPLNGFPIEKEHVSSELYPFYWSGKDYLAFATQQEVFAYTTAGKLTYQVRLNKTISAPASIVVQGKNGDLIAHVCSSTSWQSNSLKRKKHLSTKTLVSGNWTLIKVDGKVSLIGSSNKKFARMTEDGKQSILINQVADVYHIQKIGHETYFHVQQGKMIYTVSERGEIVSQTQVKSSSIASISYNKEKKIVGIVDDISNNCYIYRIKSQKLIEGDFEGANRLCFIKLNDNTLVLASQSNGYLIRYKLK